MELPISLKHGITEPQIALSNVLISKRRGQSPLTKCVPPAAAVMVLVLPEPFFDHRLLIELRDTPYVAKKCTIRFDHFTDSVFTQATAPALEVLSPYDKLSTWRLLNDL